VVPGFIDTEMVAGLSDDARRARARLAPERRFGRAEEVAEAILFLASDEAAFVTGDALYVAGAVRDVPRLEGA
jgi:3-oxoacyl-[acyl-carrier protein] reductase